MPVSDIPTIMIQADGIDTGFGSGRIGFEVSAPLLTLLPPAPGAGDTPHGEILIDVTDTSVVQLSDGTVVALPSGAVMRLGITREGLGQLAVMAGQFNGFLKQAYPPVP